ncbi:MAG: hypothetical protein IRY90_01985 [Actinomadura rubrobrunea]|nr:hypothetical protein [Actinomadura rubrobrunea]
MDTDQGIPRRPDDRRRPGMPGRPVSPSATSTGPLGVHETSGIQVRLGTRRTRDDRRGRRGGRRRAGVLAVCALTVAAGLIAAGVLLTPDLRDRIGLGKVGAFGARGDASAAALPRAGAPVEVGTADGSRYRLQTVTAGAADGTAAPQQASRSARGTYAYIDYILSNPTDHQVLLDFPGDVFVKRDLVAPEDRGRCVWQAGVPEDMCTPPTRSEVVRRLKGGPLIDGDGGDRYLPPGSSYLVRATVEVPLDRPAQGRDDLRLFIWKQLYMADQPAREVPFPR